MLLAFCVPGTKGADRPSPDNALVGDAISLLLKRVPRVDWEELRATDLMEWLSDQSETPVNVLVRWSTPEKDGVDPERTVTLTLRDVTIAEVLNEALQQLSRETKLTYHAWENFIRISTQEDFDRDMIVRVYDVRDLLFHVPNFGQAAPQIDLTNQSGHSSGGSGSGGGRSVFGSAGGTGQPGEQQMTKEEHERQAEKLRELIMATIAPESWDRGGGEAPKTPTQANAGRGRIVIFDWSLVVYSTLEVHERIAGWFTTHELTRR